MIEIGDYVYKKSRKPFQNGKRVALIIDDNCYIHTPKGLIDAVALEDCDGYVEIRILRKDKLGLKTMRERDFIDLMGV